MPIFPYFLTALHSLIYTQHSLLLARTISWPHTTRASPKICRYFIRRQRAPLIRATEEVIHADAFIKLPRHHTQCASRSHATRHMLKIFRHDSIFHYLLFIHFFVAERPPPLKIPYEAGFYCISRCASLLP